MCLEYGTFILGIELLHLSGTRPRRAIFITVIIVLARALSSFNLTREKINVLFLSRLTNSANKSLSGMLSETAAVVKTQLL